MEKPLNELQRAGIALHESERLERCKRAEENWKLKKELKKKKK